jgi:hypothetical protein
VSEEEISSVKLVGEEITTENMEREMLQRDRLA